MESTIPAVKAFILEHYLVGESPDRLTPTTELIDSGILDSLATLELVAFLEKQYAIELEAHELDATNLGTLTTIDRLVQSKLAK
jgi:acyl carrier protein